MRKFLLLLMISFITGLGAWAQGEMPLDPDAGKCWVKCKVPAVWETQTERIEMVPAYKTIVTYPAEYKTVTEKVLLKDASQRLEIVPAVYETIEIEVVVKEASHRLEMVPAEYGTKTVTYTAKDDASSLAVVPATFNDESTRIMTKSPYSEWDFKIDEENCESDDPTDCLYKCKNVFPAEYTTVPFRTLNKDAFTNKSPVPGNEKTYTYTVMTKAPTTRKIEIPEVRETIEKIVMKTPPTTRVIDIPAEYTTITKTVLVKDAWEAATVIPAVYETVEKQVLVTPAGETEWKEVQCELINYSPLPIKWNLNSATLTAEAKKIIDDRLLPLLDQGMKVELASHTDSRGSDSFNQNLSDRRANAVKQYLIGKGVSSELMVAKGYGETKLKNRCSNGVQCTEAEHQENRRTEFRVLNNND